ncbi:ribosome biogenesis factor YjgA [methanotrophic endosymbiont of Bathymodiolus puteoserpentis (Logatchev)]|jgi:ribosome-associated protein|uniref:ribosome biogenesis factor YjgA n=1 Tax=methanotrophic endosymbiont of Bathymodiolus puteoserpentis (Logatchev) TaxID=343235 RepID=UPI0013CD87D1|nr:ribosome biogenesis factor YjgA [methanotrophic endosymbiont of Bathymodiolus puteoserpentis (Logatchev)]SHE19028.1 FIG138315: Putative alpha helix protein [methanotrophic endosymbiont of Bathymodiolus puteoserpentis (Logatchev)]
MSDFTDEEFDELQRHEEGDEYEEQTWAIRPNKTQLKRDIAVIHKMCEDMALLAPAQIEKLNLPEEIEAAILAAAKMPFKAARKRQLKFITGLVRKIDIEPIEEALAKIKAKSAHATRELHQLERWRERLLSDDKQALTELLDKYPEADVQQLRQLIRNAKKEISLEKPIKSSRLLFKYLRALFENTQNIENEQGLEGDSSVE